MINDILDKKYNFTIHGSKNIPNHVTIEDIKEIDKRTRKHQI